MKIKSLRAREILDSRGKWTVEIALATKSGVRAIASVPQGKSTGSSEARALPAAEATRNVNALIAPWLIRDDFKDQLSLDAFLCKLDGTATKAKLGANATLAVSIAFARALAMEKKLPLWKYIRSLAGRDAAVKGALVHPRLFINVVNGGLHAGNNLDFQEYLSHAEVPDDRGVGECRR